MKRLFAFIALLFTMTAICNAQNDTVINVMQIPDVGGIWVCSNIYDRVIIYAAENCNNFYWFIGDEGHAENPVIIEVVSNGTIVVDYNGCGTGFTFGIYCLSPTVPTETTSLLWKREYEPLVIEPLGADSLEMYDFVWSTGETTPTIEVVEPGTYTCSISDMCATATRTFIVQDNVEIDLATCDLESNLNMVTWDVTEAQAEYIDHLRVKRDGMEVGTANYIDGYYIDNIGSGAASRTYTITAVTKDGEDCPIVSYPKETIHMAYLTGINNTIEVNWNTPTGYDLLGYNVCEWTPNGKDGELTIIDFVGAGVTSYTCTENLFNNGHVVVQGVENGKTESRLLSNRSEEGIMGIDELQKQNFKIYPNPSTGEFTVEGASSLTVYNTLGQIIATSHSETDTHSFSLRSGIYFIKSDEGVVKKVVVE